MKYVTDVQISGARLNEILHNGEASLYISVSRNPQTISDCVFKKDN